MAEHPENHPQVEDKDPMYFGYYGQMQHQQNMLADSIRTSTYQNAVLANKDIFKGATVMDLGAGSGILSFFAVQAGAKKVYAVEASGAAKRIQQIVDAAENGPNPYLKGKIVVINKKIEDPSIDIPRVDILLSEPIGVLVFHERMIESFLYARDHFLKPNGVVLPNKAIMYFAPFTDATLFSETIQKARFWENTNFYNVDFSPLASDAVNEYFRMPVVGAFDSRLLNSYAIGHEVDFARIETNTILDMTIDLEYVMTYTGLVHGISSWFDLEFAPESGQYISMSTGPQSATTHWQQIRFQFTEPIALNKEEKLYGWLKMKINEHRSYTIVGQFSTSRDGLDDPNTFEIDNVNVRFPSTMSRKDDENRFTKRTQIWYLHEQNFNYSFNYSQPPEFQPEYQCLYESR